MHTEAAHQAFSLQAPHFDEEDKTNPVVQLWRNQIYSHVNEFLLAGDDLLELNSGTGIDAMHFASTGHRVLATDASEGMIHMIRQKLLAHPVPTLAVQHISYEHLDQLEHLQYNYVFSNFGGLNCIPDLSTAARPLVKGLPVGACVTWVIMPPVCPWEIMRVFKGEWKEASRRLHKNGSNAHLEGSHFTTWYHSVSDVQKAFGTGFKLLRCEGLGVVAPPPAATRFIARFPKLWKILRAIDSFVKDIYPFNRWGDHVIITLQKTSKV